MKNIQLTALLILLMTAAPSPALENEGTAEVRETEAIEQAEAGLVESLPEEPPAGVLDRIESFQFEGDGRGESVGIVVRSLARELGLRMDVTGKFTGRMILNAQNVSIWSMLRATLIDQGLRARMTADGTLRVIASTTTPLAAHDEKRDYVLETKEVREIHMGTASPVYFRREKHLDNIKQLTFGGENAEAYFSPDGQWLIFQSTRDDLSCDQIFVMRIDGTEVRQVSTGKGRTTCGYFYPGGEKFIYSSTHLESDDCPAKPDHSQGYVWPLDPYDMFVGRLDGTGELERIASTDSYDAEATLSPDGKKVVFTSDRDGDLELYTMDLDGSNLVRVTHSPGYDGGAFFSPDSKKLVYRANRVETDEEIRESQRLLKQRLVRPSKMEIRVMDADGGNDNQVTRNGAANFAPYWHPDGERLLFVSNVLDKKGRNFDIFMVGSDGRGLERITYNPTFDGFPMFSPDGQKVVFASNRNARVRGETNIFIADWRE